MRHAWCALTKNDVAGTGVITQGMQNILPEVVHDKQEVLSVAYGNMVGILIEAIKELKKEVETFKGLSNDYQI